MPTYQWLPSFSGDLKRLSPQQRLAFHAAIAMFVADLPSGRFRSTLRVKGVRGATDVFEMRWAPNGRATFEYGAQINEGEPHVIWRRIGTHDIFDRP